MADLVGATVAHFPNKLNKYEVVQRAARRGDALMGREIDLFRLAVVEIAAETEQTVSGDDTPWLLSTTPVSSPAWPLIFAKAYMRILILALTSIS